MLLGDMGPVDLSKTDGGKLFAGGYALYAGLVFIATAALVLTPVLHRLLHRFPLGRERMSVPGVKVRRSANVLSARMAMAAGVSALGLVSATPGGPGPIDRAFLAGLCRGPA
jgi:hypothetical protein